MNKIFKIILVLSLLKLSLAQDLKNDLTTVDSDKSITSDWESNPCELIKPYCRCANWLLVDLECKDFDSFGQLDFSPFGLQNNETRIFESIYLYPRVPLRLNDSLKITNIAIKKRVYLSNIDGIELTSNPFKNAISGERVEIQLTDSNLRTFQTSCDTNILTDEYVSFFSLFDSVSVGLTDGPVNELCPLIFHNSNLRSFSISNLNGLNRMKFSQLITNDDSFDLNSTVDSLTINSFRNAIIDQHLIDKHVFARMEHFYLLDYEMDLYVDERAFYHAQNLKKIIIFLKDMRKFVQSSNNTWMNSLNRNVRVNYSDPDSVQENLPNALLITFDAFNWVVNYTFPNEDLIYFENFPHERLVFFKFIAQRPFECTETLRQLLQNAQFYEPIESLNNTATFYCFTDEPFTTESSSTTKTVSTTISISGYDPCQLIEPYCRCAGFRSIKSVERIICEEFDSFEQIDFSPFGFQDNQTTIVRCLNLSPKVPLTLDDSLKITNIGIQNSITLTNIHGIELFSNPFKNVLSNDLFGNEIGITIRNSILRTFQTSCDTSLLTNEYVSLFSLFNNMGIELKEESEGDLCPLIFHNANIRALSISNINDKNYVKFSDLMNGQDGFDLNSTVDWLSFSFAYQPIIFNEHMIDEKVFRRLRTLNLFTNDNNFEITDGTFYKIQNLKEISFSFRNFENFVKSSNHTWMNDLNRNVRVNYTDPGSVQDNLPNALLVSFSMFYWGVTYTFPDADLDYFKHFPRERFVFFSLIADTPFECTETLRWLLQYAQYYEPIMSLNNTATSYCFNNTQFSTITPTQTTTTTTIDSANDPCELIKPYCRCITWRSVDGIICDEFDSFDQLDFRPFGYPDNQTTMVKTLEFNPKIPLVLNDSLKISNIVIRDAVVLKNIDSIDLISNPFKNGLNGNRVALIVSNSNVRTTQITCDTSVLTDNYQSLFSSFDTISFYFDDANEGELCPLIFHNVSIGFIYTYGMNGNNKLKFSQFTTTDDNFILNSNVDSLGVLTPGEAIIDEHMIDKHVFGRMKTFYLNAEDVKFDLNEQTFYHAQALKQIILQLGDVESFVRRFNNTWMNSLNRNVRVNYSDPDSVEQNLQNALLITLDPQSFGESYLFPDEDFDYFKNFPHERLVFFRLTGYTVYECTKTLRWLLQNAQFYEPIMSLNNTATMNCFNETRSTTTTNFTPESTLITPVSTLITPESTLITTESAIITSESSTLTVDSSTTSISGHDPCELIKPYCVCETSFIFNINCRDFDSFEQIDFSPFGYPNNESKLISNLDLHPRVPLTLNDSLQVSFLTIKYNVKLTNINGIELLSRPFRNTQFESNAGIIIENSNVRTFETSCSTRILTDQYVSLFSSFNRVEFGSGNSYDGTLCPLIFYNASITSLFMSNMNGSNSLKFAQLTTDDQNFDLNSNVNSLDIGFATRLVIDEHLINKNVFIGLRNFNLFGSNLARIDQKAFYDTQHLKEIRLRLDNFKTFIQSSDNEWMSNLNRDVRVNYTDPDSVEQNLNNALLISFDFRYNEPYTFPDEDLVYFRNFPHERFVFATIVGDEELECTETLKFLLQNAAYYEPIMSLNTTATTNCFTSTQSPSSGSTSKPTVYQSSTQPTNQFSSPITEPTTKPENQTTEPIIQYTTQPENQTTTEPIIQYTTQPENQTTITQQTSRVSILSTVASTNGYNSTEQESKEVLLSVYLWTVIPIGVVCLLAIIGFVVFLFLYLSQRAKITPENSVNNNDNIALNTMQTSSQVD